MIITDASSSEIKQWFYSSPNPFLWMGIVLPSASNDETISELVNSINTIDRRTGKIFALMIFFDSNRLLSESNEIARFQTLCLNSYTFANMHCCALNNFLQEFIVRKSDNYKNDILNSISQTTTLTSDVLRRELSLRSNDSYFVLYSKFQSSEPFILKLDSILSTKDLIETLNPFWLNLDSLEKLKNKILRNQREISSLKNKIGNYENVKEVECDLKKLNTIFSDEIKKILLKFDIYTEKSFSRTDIGEGKTIDIVGRYINIDGLIIELEHVQKKELAIIISEYNRSYKELIKIIENFPIYLPQFEEEQKNYNENVNLLHSIIKEMKNSIEKSKRKYRVNSFLTWAENFVVKISAEFLSNFS